MESRTPIVYDFQTIFVSSNGISVELKTLLAGEEKSICFEYSPNDVDGSWIEIPGRDIPLLISSLVGILPD